MRVINHQLSRQAHKKDVHIFQIRLNLEPSLIRFCCLRAASKDRIDLKLKSLIMAQIERWRQA
ncbi:hypothetical protein E8Q34_05550 [Halomonas sp. 15WGF]|nr:hypothetical protein E8Q34_05550 [Halomonas sp. 15WGF]